jgi:hypothetical protein
MLWFNPIYLLMKKNFTHETYFFQNDSGLEELSDSIGFALRKDIAQPKAQKSSIQMLINYACSLEIVKTNKVGLVEVLLN